MHFFFDFDGTITTKDTIGHLGDTAVRFQQQRQASNDSNHAVDSEENGAAVDVDFAAAWQRILKAYMADYAAYSSNFHPAERETLDDEVAFQRGLRGLDMRSVRRVEEAGLFRGMQDGDFAAAARHEDIKLRKGFREFLHLIKRVGQHDVTIISANWSRQFIEAVVGEPGLRIIAQAVSPEGLILPPTGCSVTSGRKKKEEDDDDDDEYVQLGSDEQGLRIATSEDKKRAMDAINENGSHTHQGFFAYFGDSLTDLECLVAAADGERSWGLVLADDDDSKLLKTLRRIGRNVPHISELNDCGAVMSGGLFWARDFEDCLACVPADGPSKAAQGLD